MIKIILLIAPLILFLSKSVLPLMCKIAFSKADISLSQIVDECIKLSIDYLFAAISYLLPKSIEAFYRARALSETVREISEKIDKNIYLEQQKSYMNQSMMLIMIVVILIFCSPFLVILNEMAIKLGDSGRKKTKWLIILLVATICVGSCYYSISLY